MSTHFKLIFFTPPSALSAIKRAVFATGAGTYPGSGGYTEVCFTSHGTGQFRPGDTAKPHIGTPGQVEEVEEVRCEVFCGSREVAVKAVKAVKATHPYEEPVYEVYKIEDFSAV